MELLKLAQIPASIAKANSYAGAGARTTPLATRHEAGS
jgi:hypothetical protein